MKRVAGVVLAGGRSRRFGRDKAVEPIGERDMLEWALGALLPYSEVLLVAGRQTAPAPCVDDRPGPGFGPLGGLAGALRSARTRGCTHVLSAACDTPFIDASLLRGLLAQQKPAFLDRCPVIGIWPVSLADALERHLAAGGTRTVVDWALSIGATSLRTELPIPNLNRVEDLPEIIALHG